MKIVIPMSGFGERFRKYGYKIPKPLIEIDGIHMIGHVVNLFPDESDFLFICNEDHLKNDSYNMEKIIKSYSPKGKILAISPHKLGPAYAVLQAKNLLLKEEEVIINYCDFSCLWDWYDFKKFVKNNSCECAIPAYKGFHPHSLGKTNYAYIKENNNSIVDIKEKEPFTGNKMDEFASSGTYYFSSGKILIESIESLIKNKNKVNGEYYMSLACKELIKRNKKVLIYEIYHFFQWGTPQDLEEYLIWSKTFRFLANKIKKISSIEGTLLVPMAGLGKRFIDEGYTKAKPFINVSGSPMIIQALNYLPNHFDKVFVMRKNMLDQKKVSNLIKKEFPESKIKIITKFTEGQASTALIGTDALINKNSFLTIAACDSGSIYNKNRFQNLLYRSDIDILVWSTREHINAKRNPNMFGWIDADASGKIIKISTKLPIENDLNKQIITGTFTFKNFNIFEKSIKRLFNRKGKINGEYYIDSSINDAIDLGFKCYLFEVDAFISWGTPNDLKTFEYWQSTFDKWKYHRYSLNNDQNILKNNKFCI